MFFKNHSGGWLASGLSVEKNKKQENVWKGKKDGDLDQVRSDVLIRLGEEANKRKKEFQKKRLYIS